MKADLRSKSYLECNGTAYVLRFVGIVWCVAAVLASELAHSRSGRIGTDTVDFGIKLGRFLAYSVFPFIGMVVNHF